MEALQQNSTIDSMESDVLNTVFKPHEAKEFVAQFIAANINFFKLQNLSYQDRFGLPNEDVWQKIDDLEAWKKSIEPIISEANAQGNNLILELSLRIKPV